MQGIRITTDLGLRIATVIVTLLATGLVGVSPSHASVQVGDDTSFTFVAGGDIGASAETSATLAAINAVSPDFMLALGDLSYSTIEPEAAWCDYMKSYLGATPVEVIVGNHEDDSGRDGDIGNFADCLPDKMGSVGAYGTEYFFDVNGLMRVIMIGADTTVAGITYDYSAGSVHHDWLSGVIDDARAQNIPWVAVGMHKVCITAGVKPCEIGPDLMGLLIDKKVDLVLSGHEHNYQRSRQLGCATVGVFTSTCVAYDGDDGSYVKNAGPIFVVSGAMGGRPRYPINESDPEYPYFAQTMGAGDTDEGSGFLMVDVSPGRLVADFVGTTSGYSDRFEIVEHTSAPSELVIVRAPLEDIGSRADAGAVTLLTVEQNGSVTGASLIHQGSPGVPSLSEAGDEFGHATVWADLDRNGVDDLVVGVPLEDIGSVVDAGAIVVLYNAASGSFTNARTFHQGSAGIPARTEPDDQWGYALASGDFNADSYPDVAIGAPNEAIGNVQSGAVTILFGGPVGLSTSGAVVLHQNTAGVPGVNEGGDRFGASLAVAGTVGTSQTLAVGSPGEDIGSIVDAGAVTLFGSTPTGLSPEPELLYQGVDRTRRRPAVEGIPESGDRWGLALAGNPRGNLVIGAPFDDPEDVVDAGSITIYSHIDGTPTTRLVSQASPGVPGSSESGDRWGYTLDTDDALIVVGAPFETDAGVAEAGRVTILRYEQGANIGAGHTITQETVGGSGAREARNRFGSSVSLTSSGSLFIGSSGDDAGTLIDAGSGTVVFDPESPTSAVVLDQGTLGVPGVNEPFDAWGG